MARRWSRGSEQADTSGTRWEDVFGGDASREAYQREFRAHTSATWELVESGHDDLLRLLVRRVPADLGAPAIFALSVLFAGHPKGDDAGRALLGTVLSDLSPPRARTMLVTLADAWHNAERQPIDRRAGVLRAALLQAARRLSVANLPEEEREALRFVTELVEPEDPSAS